MKTEINFLEMFSGYRPPEELAEVLRRTTVSEADINTFNRRITLTLLVPQYIPQKKLRQVGREIQSRYDLNGVEMTAVFPPSELPRVDPQELMELFVEQDSMNRASLAGAQWEWEGNTLTVRLPGNGKKLLEACIPEVRQELEQRFSTKVEIQIEAGHDLTGQALFDATQRLRCEMIEALPTAAAPQSKKPQMENPGAILGSPFQGAPTPMRDLTLNMNRVVLEGKVLAVNHRELKKRNAWIASFDITDHTGSARVEKFLENRKAKGVLERIAVGSVLRVLGKPKLYNGSMILEPSAIMPGFMPPREDTAPGEKRVELHLHTAMSRMDALTDVGDAIRQAAAWGHRAIAITDHGVAHAFPDAMKAAAKVKVSGTDQPIKILYGCEGYYINDVDIPDGLTGGEALDAVSGDQDMTFDQGFVAFDLETTGLSAETDRIIEIGAVLIENGREIDRFQTFVDPEQPLEMRITELTGITGEMLQGAPKIGEVLPRFLNFCAGRVLTAHNAEFDTGFIRRECQRLHYPYSFTVVDTLALSQGLLPQLGRHKLDVVASALELPEFQHHRAADDALTCGLILDRLFAMLEDRGIHTLRQIEPATPAMSAVKHHLDKRSYHIVVFAKNQLGLRNLYHLISDSNLKYFKKRARMPKSALNKLREGLIIGSACEAGELFQAIIAGKPFEELKRIAAFYDYLEIQPLDNNRFMLTNGMARDEEQLREFNRTVVRLGEALGKPVVATGDVHFMDPSDEIFRHVLLSVLKYPDFDRDNPLYFRTTDEMLREFAYLGEDKAYEVVVANPNHIADMCETIRPVPHNLFAPAIENSVEDLKSLVYGKLHRLYGENPPELITKRVETELHDIISCHYDVIYMSAQKLVQNSLEHGYLVGSRGSVGSSIVAYLAGITEVNAFPPHYRCPNPDCKYTTFEVPKGYACGADLPDAVCPKCGTPFEKDGFNIPFETFLGFGGDKVPDIDLNFSGEYQAKAHAYCTEMFGKSHVFRAGTIGKIKDKVGFGYVKQYFEAKEQATGKKTEVNDAELSRLAMGCVGVRRTTSQHPGGLVIIPQENEVWDFCPVQYPADDPKADQVTTHFEYHSMEENLLKLDMLGHDDPTMIRMMEDMTGVDAKKIPLDDKKTMSIFTSSKVLGYEDDPILGPTGAVAIPEFNTRFTRGMLMDTMPTRFDTLLRLSGFSHGTDVWLGNAKDLILSKKATVDEAIGCRDDIMLYLISKGMPEKRAFKIMESVRKGRGLPDGAEAEMREAGVPDWYIGSCKKIKYLFPKAHAVAYVMMAFRIAWFKVYYPLAFYAAYFYRRSQKGGFDAELMIKDRETVEANIKAISGNEDASDRDEDMLTTLEVVYEFYLRGFSFLPLDIYQSHATRFEIVDGKLRPPFVAIPGLGENAAWSLMEGRKGRKFLSIEEVAAACPKVSKSHIQMLKDAGAFGDMPELNQVSLF